MTCFRPVPAFQGGPGEQARLLPPLGTANLNLPCGKCLGCRTDRAREWAERCRHEASCHLHSIFATLTYDDEHLPGELVPSHVEDFIRALRQRARRQFYKKRKRALHVILTNPTSAIRFFISGEYGDLTNRPHYHALLFNCEFADKTEAGADLWRSETLTKLWGKGEVKYGQLTARSAAYSAGYASKKLCDDDGVVIQPPFVRCSRKPGIGLPWLRTYAEDLRHGYCVTADGVKMPIPRYYRKKLDGSAVGDEIGVACATPGTPRLRRTPAQLAAAEAIAASRRALTRKKL